jgi:two-component system chemotaxis response regulator CheY
MNDRFTILLAEDSALMRSLIRDMLRPAEQFTVIEAANGQQALEALRKQQVDMVLSDWNMQPMNGLQLLHAMRGDADLAEVPFVLMTGEQTPQTITHAVAAGVAGFLTKPFGRDQLAKLITRVIVKRSHAA